MVSQCLSKYRWNRRQAVGEDTSRLHLQPMSIRRRWAVRLLDGIRKIGPGIVCRFGLKFIVSVSFNVSFSNFSVMSVRSVILGVSCLF